MTEKKSAPVHGAPFYTRGEEIMNAVTHGVGAALGIAGTVLLILRADGEPWRTVSSAIYGASMILLFTMSCLYHAISAPRAKRVMRVFDHTSIFLLIAGTYTPVTLVTLRGAVGWVLFGVVWSACITGIVLNAISIERFRKFSRRGVERGLCSRPDDTKNARAGTYTSACRRHRLHSRYTVLPQKDGKILPRDMAFLCSCRSRAAIFRSVSLHYIIGWGKKLILSFLPHPTTWSRRLNTAVLPPRKQKTKARVGKTDQGRIKNAGIPTGIFEWLLKTSSF